MSAKELLFKLAGKAIICDLDDVIGDFAIPMNKLMNKASGVELAVTDYLTYDYYSRHGLTREDFLNIVIDNDVFLNMPVKPGAREGLQLLIDKGYEIHIVTARGAFKYAYELTKVWLDSNDIPYTTLHVVDTKVTPKSEVYRNIEGAACLLDDAPYNIVDALNSDLNIIPIVINQPWNREFKEAHELGDNHANCRFDNIHQFAEKVQMAA